MTFMRHRMRSIEMKLMEVYRSKRSQQVIVDCFSSSSLHPEPLQLDHTNIYLPNDRAAKLRITVIDFLTACPSITWSSRRSSCWVECHWTLNRIDISIFRMTNLTDFFSAWTVWTEAFDLVSYISNWITWYGTVNHRELLAKHTLWEENLRSCLQNKWTKEKRFKFKLDLVYSQILSGCELFFLGSSFSLC